MTKMETLSAGDGNRSDVSSESLSHAENIPSAKPWLSTNASHAMMAVLMPGIIIPADMSDETLAAYLRAIHSGGY